MKEEYPFVSVAVVALNAEKTIKECLDSLINLNYPKHKYEIMLIDGYSKDNTIKIANNFKNVKIFHNKAKITASGRNIAIKKSKYNFLAFIDSDCVAPEDWLKILTNNMNVSSSEIAGVGGANIAPKNAERFVKAISIAQRNFLGNLGSAQGKIFNKKQVVDSLATCNVLYRKKNLYDIGMFSEQDKDLGEDWILNYKLRERGYKLLIVPESFVWHNFRSTPKKFFSNMFRYGMARAIIIKRYPKTIKIVNVLPIFFLFTLPMLFTLYLIIIFVTSYRMDKDLWQDIFKVYILQHFGYSLGEISGLLFDDGVRI